MHERRDEDSAPPADAVTTVDTTARQTLDWLNRNVWVAVIGGIANFGVAAFALWPTAGHTLLLGWLAFGVALGLLRLSLAVRYRHYPASLRATAWLRIHRGLTLAAGLHLALLSVAMFPAADPHRQALVVVITAGMVACAVSFHALDRLSIELYSLPPTAALVWRYVEMGTPLGWSVAGLAIVFTLSMWRAGDATRAAVLRNIALTRSLHHLATHDPLVPLANRTEFMRRLRAAAARVGDTQRGIALLFVDLDHFKSLNDSQGHAAGDEALVRVGTEVRVLLRAGDFAARIGGDEFVVMLEPGDAPRARSVAEKLLAGIDNLDLAVPGARLSASIGIAASSADGADPDTLLRRADAACYQAKEAGRGRIVVSNGAATQRT